MSNSTNSLPQSCQRVEDGAFAPAIQKILVVVDPIAARHPCIEKAARLAASFNSTLELYICDSDQHVPESWTPVTQHHSFLRERRLTMLEALAAPIRERGIHVTAESEWHAPLEEGIVDHAIRSQADLVLKDAHRNESMSYMPFSPTDRMLIRNLPMPLLLVRSRPWPQHPLVATCVDPCHAVERPMALDESLLAMSGSISRALTGQVSVLHALEPPVHLRDEPLDRGTVEVDYRRQRTAVAEVAGRASVSGDSLRFQEGHFPDSLIQMAKRENSDLLVIGVAARQRSMNRAGSTAWRVLEQTESDLLVVKPPGFVSPALLSEGDISIDED
jgi:universal stress protein E